MIADRAAVTRYVGAIAAFCAMLVGAAGATGGGSAAVLVGALVGVAAVARVAIVLVAETDGAPAVRDARGRRVPRGDADLSTLVAQSHPDAAGHVRSRAPGTVSTAA